MDETMASAGTVLVVDDERGIREVLVLSLEMGGYRCIPAEDGVAALAAFDSGENEVGLVITDLNMPEMDGISLVRHLRERRPALPIVVSSGCITDEHRVTLAELGVAAVLAKPYTATQLLQCVDPIVRAECGLAA
jgi:two-component system, cell cycle sensor histidine kinase and response regulator CckA